MSISVCIVMDWYKNINPLADTTYGLSFEAKKRGILLYMAVITGLSLKNNEVWANVKKLDCSDVYPYLFCPEDDLVPKPLDTFDFVIMRKDPPVDETFQFAVHLLRFCREAKVLNCPESILQAPEKVFPYHFENIFPPGIITASPSKILSFLEQQQPGIIVKPLNECGGKGIVYLSQDDKNCNSILEMMTEEGTKFITAQRYLPEIREGDKRIICLDGEVVGSLLRVPPANDHRANLHVGGAAKFISRLTEREIELTQTVSSSLREQGLYFVGFDVIGDYITEINVTSPTGIREILAQGGADIARLFWQKLLD